jgi:2-C-methyl-D-erythritol 4-phosphate cytidylyltransferase
LDVAVILLYNQVMSSKTKTDNHQKVGAIIVAAGESQRMGGIDKVLALLGGKPVLLRVIDTFQKCNSINQMVVVVSQDNLKKCRHLIAEEEWAKVVEVCAGGKRRQDSVVAGLNHLVQCQWVVIHDGARPLLTVDLIERGLEAAGETGAAVAAVPVTDTIKVAGEYRLVQQTLPRHNLWAVQTPQVFRFDIIAEAYERAKDEVTDDASLVEQSGYKVGLYMGSYHNIKVTTPDDLALAEWMLYHGKATQNGLLPNTI